MIAIPDSKAMTSSASGVTSSEKGKGKGKKGESSKTAEKKVGRVRGGNGVST